MPVIGHSKISNCRNSSQVEDQVTQTIFGITQGIYYTGLMPGFYHSVAVLPLPFRRSAIVKFRCSVKIM